jgi:hypothetical protein
MADLHPWAKSWGQDTLTVRFNPFTRVSVALSTTLQLLFGSPVGSPVFILVSCRTNRSGDMSTFRKHV